MKLRQPTDLPIDAFFDEPEALDPTRADTGSLSESPEFSEERYDPFEEQQGDAGSFGREIYEEPLDGGICDERSYDYVDPFSPQLQHEHGSLVDASRPTYYTQASAPFSPYSPGDVDVDARAWTSNSTPSFSGHTARAEANRAQGGHGSSAPSVASYEAGRGGGMMSRARVESAASGAHFAAVPRVSNLFYSSTRVA